MGLTEADPDANAKVTRAQQLLDALFLQWLSLSDSQAFILELRKSILSM